MLDARIVGSAREYLSGVDRQGIPVRFGVLYGSWATGRVHEWSDIEPVACGERQWVEDDASAIIEIARREGARISLEDAVGPRI
jgi:predicted nucleotidyltransferase